MPPTGLIFDDERGVTVLSTAGFGFLLFIEATGVTSVAEGFAAGYQCAAQIHSVANDLDIGLPATGDKA